MEEEEGTEERSIQRFLYCAASKCQACAGGRDGQQGRGKTMALPSARRQNQAYTVNRSRNLWWQLDDLRERDRWCLSPGRKKKKKGFHRGE